MRSKFENLIVLVGASAAMAAMVSSPAIAAVQGTQGSTSSGSSDITLEVKDSVKITGIDDLTIPSVEPTAEGGTQAGGSFCVFKNGGDDVNITASNPANGATEFALTGGADSDTIQYTVALATGQDASSASAVSYNAAVQLSGASTEFACGGSDTHAFEIFVAEQEIREATTGSYTGTLQFLVEPI